MGTPRGHPSRQQPGQPTCPGLGILARYSTFAVPQLEGDAPPHPEPSASPPRLQLFLLILA